MPGKINPTLSEMVIQIAHQVVGNDVAVSMATTRANLTSTFGMPPSTSASSRACSFYKCLFESMQLVGDELVILRRDCVEGIVACEDRCPAEAESSIALSRVLATIFGYPEGVKVAHYCEEHGVTVKEAVLAMGLLNEADADRLIDPILMTDPEAMARAIAEFRARIDG